MSALVLGLAVGLAGGWWARGLRRRDAPAATDDLAALVPDAVRRLFAATTRRGVGPVALQIVSEVFDPEQSAFFHARPADRRLSLAAGRGLPPGAAPGLEIDFGQGAAGQAAEHRRITDASDLAGTVPGGAPAQEYGPGLRVDVAAPILDEGGELMGVLTLAGARSRKGEEKPALSLLASLTGLAVTHVTRLRATQQIADQDALTGTYNKRYVQQRLADEVARAASEGRPLSLLLLDIDHFKSYNDSRGHVEGDQALRQVGQVLNASVREDDTAGRYGGDEFLVLLPGANGERARTVAEHLRRSMEALALDRGGESGALTLSAGVATFPEDATTGVGLVRAADQALYEAKAQGRNRVVTARSDRLT